MPKNDSRWIFYLLGRVLTHALLGGVATALGGALCIGAGGALTGWIVARSSGLEAVYAGFFVGRFLGGCVGALVGILSFAIIGFALPPRRGMLLPRGILLPVILGQIAGTATCAASFFGVMALLSLSGGPFRYIVDQHALWIIFGGPAVMGCAQIAATSIAFRRYKNAFNLANLLT